MLFLRKMPYREPPMVLRQRVAALMRAQLRDIPQLDPAQRRDLVERGGMVFLSRMMDFLLPEERADLEAQLADLESGF